MSGGRIRGGRLSELIRSALLCAVLCVLSVITLPIGAVPVTLSLLGVFLIGFLLPPRSALLCVLGYLLLGAVGLPVFSSMQGGIGVLLGPTGGYLWCYPVTAVLPSLVGVLGGSAHRVRFGRIAAACIGLVLCYVVGSLRLAAVSGVSFGAAVLVGVVPFVLPDILKLAAAAVLSARLGRMLF